LTFEVEHVNQAAGRNIGYVQEIFFSSPGVINLGFVRLDNPWLQLGWDSYKQKDFHQSLYYFNRALNSRKLSAVTDDFTLSSSAYNGIGWVLVKRGKDNFATNPMFPGFEWDQGIIHLDKALNYQKDADAWVGKGGALMTMVADVYPDPVQLGPILPIYAYVKFHFNEAYECFDHALINEPDYLCEHDLISADDLRVAQLFITWLEGGTVTLSAIEDYTDNGDINEGSMQILSILPDLLLYEPYPQL
jgi:tetratricopeptide (TPR) repeat protein